REVERRAPAIATSKWWKEERHGVFLDYNQNAKDRTIASAYSVRPTQDARVSAPLTWEEIDECNPADFTLKTMPARFAQVGDRRASELHRMAARALGETRARRAGRRAVAAALQETGRRAGTRTALEAADILRSVEGRRAKAETSADRNWPRAGQGCGARRPR